MTESAVTAMETRLEQRMDQGFRQIADRVDQRMDQGFRQIVDYLDRRLYPMGTRSPWWVRTSDLICD